jgi:hypothetical protein
MATATVTTTANITVIQTSTRKRGECRVKMKTLVFSLNLVCLFCKFDKQQSHQSVTKMVNSVEKKIFVTFWQKISSCERSH